MLPNDPVTVTGVTDPVTAGDYHTVADYGGKPCYGDLFEIAYVWYHVGTSRYRLSFILGENTDYFVSPTSNVVGVYTPVGEFTGNPTVKLN